MAKGYKHCKSEEERKQRRKEATDRFYQKNKEKDVLRRIELRNKNPISYMFSRVKSRALKQGIEFSISKEDIIIPEKCPILDIILKFGTMKQKASSPSLDRVDNSKGYIKGNVRVISQKANHLKSDMSLETIKRLLDYVSQQ